MTNKYDILWLDKVDSTNSEARKRISYIDNLSVMSAYEQTNGRGQRGNIWHSKAGENLTFSIILKFGNTESSHIRAYDQFAISQIASLAVVEFLSLYDIQAKIKWPNDIYVDNRKICGILVENSLNAEYISWSIIGIGLNVNQSEFPAGTTNPTSMTAETGHKYEIEPLLTHFIEIFEDYRRRYLHYDGGLDQLRDLYLSRMWKINQETHFIDYTGCDKGHFENPINVTYSESEVSGRVFHGIIRGLSDVGMLVVEENGKTKEYGFKEIGWIIKPI